MNKCEIVKDLLPNYNEKLTSDNTNSFIEEHLSSCSSCNNIYKNMNDKVNLDLTDKIDYDINDIKSLKKLNSKIKKALFLGITIGLLILIITYISIVLYRFIILKNLSNKFDNYKHVDNVYFEENDTYFSGDSRFVVNRLSKYWYSNNILKEEHSSTDTDFPNVYTRIVDYNANLEYRYNSINKSLQILEFTNSDSYKDRKTVIFLFFIYVYDRF